MLDTTADAIITLFATSYSYCTSLTAFTFVLEHLKSEKLNFHKFVLHSVQTIQDQNKD